MSIVSVLTESTRAVNVSGSRREASTQGTVAAVMPHNESGGQRGGEAAQGEGVGPAMFPAAGDAVDREAQAPLCRSGVDRCLLGPRLPLEFFLLLRRVPRTLDLDFRDGGLDPLQIVRRQLDSIGSDVPRDDAPWSCLGSGDPRFLCQQPRVRSAREMHPWLRRSRRAARSGRIRRARFCLKSRQTVAYVVALERRVFADRASQTLAERAERHETDAQLFQCRQDRFLGFTPPQGVLAL